LLGNMWRFDLNAGTATKLAELGSDKPITVLPEIADVDGNTVVFFGSGRYLGEDDLNLTTAQTMYGLKDDGRTTISGTSQLIQQTAIGTGATRTLTNNAVDWSSKFGWYVNLLDSGERINIDPQIYVGTILMASIVPTASACQQGGYSWLYQLDYKTGGYVEGGSTVGATKYTSPIVGVTVSLLPSGTPMIYAISADGKKPTPVELKISAGDSGASVKRVLWRELAE